jgi:hypothetical protein
MSLKLSLMNIHISIFINIENIGLGLWCYKHHFQQYFSYIMAVSFIGEGNRSTRKNDRPPTVTDKVLSSTPRNVQDSNSQR